MADKTKVEKYPLEYGTDAWDKAAMQLAYSYSPGVYECQKCGAPVLKGYCCMHCGDDNPTSSKD